MKASLRPALHLLTTVLALALCIPGPAHAVWTLVRDAASFETSGLTDPGALRKIRDAGTLGGAPGDWGITGWVGYEFEVPASGWYELLARATAAGMEFRIDPGADGQSDVSFYEGAGPRDGEDRVGSVWLTAGRHQLRMQRYYWTGFPRNEGFILRAARGEPAKSMSASIGRGARLYRVGECPALELRSGGSGIDTKLTVWTRDRSGSVRRVDSVRYPAADVASVRKIALFCEEEGSFRLTFGRNDRAFSPTEVKSIDYEVVDTRTPPAESAFSKTLVDEIDVISRPPDYVSGGSTRIVRTAAGTYRESGDTGFTRYQRAPTFARKILAEPSWFAYRLDGILAQRPYLVEVDYPDDQLRTFGIALRESAPLSYPVAGGVDSGGEFAPSMRTLTHSLLYWPRAPATRLTFLNAHDGRRAAASRIRVYRLDGTLPPLETRQSRGRSFLNWYEEGTNFLSMYGAPDDPTSAPRVAAQRWAEAARYAGANVLAPTVSVYGMALYPSHFNLAFSRPDFDYLRRILLTAEKSRLQVLPELHARADELAWPYVQHPDPKPNLLVSKDGKTNFYQADGKSRVYPPLYNPLHPANQDWYVGMIGELADRYADSPALIGINLRLMQWANPALNNFHSLDWGYDDYTIGLFKQEAGSAVPLGGIDDGDRFNRRYRWLMANARAQWIEWRCRKIAQLYARISERIRRARPDLLLYSSVFQWEPSDTPREALRDAGLDPAMLGRIPGVRMINALHAYGRSEASPLVTQKLRDQLLDPDNLSLFAVAGEPASFLASAKYLEATDAIAPAASMGFAAATPATWTSAVANPAGRQALERFAVELAQTDAQMLGDGGNAYSLGQPVLREFLAEFRSLPPEPFSPRRDARD
ncbi:MAG: family 10 glycosylhydrolase, partial [Betaproteobacteria bacterium]